VMCMEASRDEGARRLQKPHPGRIRIWKQDSSPICNRSHVTLIQRANDDIQLLDYNNIEEAAIASAIDADSVFDQERDVLHLSGRCSPAPATALRQVNTASLDHTTAASSATRHLLCCRRLGMILS
jgi:hypothetical protein